MVEDRPSQCVEPATMEFSFHWREKGNPFCDFCSLGRSSLFLSSLFDTFFANIAGSYMSVVRYTLCHFIFNLYLSSDILKGA
jgi:hypothetical protein